MLEYFFGFQGGFERLDHYTLFITDLSRLSGFLKFIKGGKLSIYTFSTLFSRFTYRFHEFLSHLHSFIPRFLSQPALDFVPIPFDLFC